MADIFGGNTGSPVPTSPTYSSSGGAVLPQTPVASSVSPTPQLPSSISSSYLTQTPQLQFPSTPSIDNGSLANAGIPTPQSIVNQANVTTQADQQQTSILQNVADLTGNEQSLATKQIQQENQAGVSDLFKTQQTLANQLQGYNDQLSKLQIDAGAGGTIDNQDSLNAIGKQSTYGQQVATTADLRRNQIQQASIATSALTTKAAYYAAEQNYTLAKQAADNAAQVAFDAQEQQIKYQQANLAVIQPQLNKEQAARATLIQAQLQDRQTQIANQREDFKTGQAMAIAAMQSNPNDANAQFAAQQALKLDPTDPQYLKKVTALVGNYQTLDTKLKMAQLTNTQLDTQIKRQSLGGGSPNVGSYTPQQQAQLKSSGFLNYNSETQGLAQQLVDGNIAPADLSKRSTGTSPYNKILSAADAFSMATKGKHFDIAQAQRDYKFATNVQTQNTLNYLGSLIGTDNGSGSPSGGNLDQLISLSNARLAAPDTRSITGREVGAGQGLPALNNVEQWAKLQTGDPQMAAYYATITEVSDQVAKILQGGGTGSGTSDAKLAQAQALFQKGFTPAQIIAVASSLKDLLSNRAKGVIGDNPYLSDYADKLGIKQNQPMTGTLPSGVQVTRNSDGSITDAQGNKYDENGNKI